MVPSEVILQIKDAVDLAGLIQSQTELRMSGESLIGLCPFHNEKTPSFHVYHKTKHYHCYGCKAHGDCIDFVMHTNQCNFNDAVTSLAKQAGLSHLIRNDRNKYTDNNKHSKVYEAYELAMNLYMHCLHGTPEGKKGLDFLAKRGLSDEVIQTYKIGFAPDSWDYLKDHLDRHSVRAEQAHEWGLLGKSTKSADRYYDLYRNRIIFPIFDHQNRVVAFGGRVIENLKDAPKYINTKTTPIYIKGQYLYGLNQAMPSIAKEKSVYIVEGYLDQISLYQYNIGNVVACLGTALTTTNISRLKSYSKKIYLLFDGDSAGQDAAEKSMLPVLKSNSDCYVISLPNGQDPDDFIRSKGIDAFLLQAQKAEPIFTFFLKRKIQKHGLSRTGFADILNLLIPIIVDLDDSITRQFLIEETASILNFDIEAIQDEVKKARGKQFAKTAQPNKLPINSEVDISNLTLNLSNKKFRPYFETLGLIYLLSCESFEPIYEECLMYFKNCTDPTIKNIGLFLVDRIMQDKLHTPISTEHKEFLGVDKNIENELNSVIQLAKEKYKADQDVIRAQLKAIILKSHLEQIEAKKDRVIKEFKNSDSQKDKFLTSEHENAFKKGLELQLTELSSQKKRINDQLLSIREQLRSNPKQSTLNH